MERGESCFKTNIRVREAHADRGDTIRVKEREREFEFEFEFIFIL